MSNGVIFLLFILSIVISAGISFAISSRFYNMVKRDNRVQSELRALRRDIEDKFSSGVKKISESAAEIKNTNENYSRDGGFKKPQAQKTESVKMERSELEDLAKRWNIVIEEDEEPNLDSEKKKVRTERVSDYKPKRENDKPVQKTHEPEPLPEDEDYETDYESEKDRDDYDDYKGDTKSLKKNGVKSAVRNKAKAILGDIFPFDDEE